jgi:ABC-type transport system substrate-binding protein
MGPAGNNGYDYKPLDGESTDSWMQRMYLQAVTIQNEFNQTGLNGTVVTGDTSGRTMGQYTTEGGVVYASVQAYLDGAAPLVR